jgi:hypothetical protein
MIATANTIIAALSTLKEWGVPMSHTKVVCVLGSRQGIERVATEFPEVEVSFAEEHRAVFWRLMLIGFVAGMDRRDGLGFDKWGLHFAWIGWCSKYAIAWWYRDCRVLTAKVVLCI